MLLEILKKERVSKSTDTRKRGPRRNRVFTFTTAVLRWWKPRFSAKKSRRSRVQSELLSNFHCIVTNIPRSIFYKKSHTLRSQKFKKKRIERERERWGVVFVAQAR